MVTSFRTLTESIGWCSNWLDPCLRRIAQDLAATLPARLRAHLSGRRGTIEVELSLTHGRFRAVLPDGQTMSLDDPSQQENLNRIAKKQLVAFRVPPGTVLATILRVPERAAAKLDGIVTTNISVWTPFTLDEIFFKAKAAPRSGAPTSDRDSTRVLELRCVPKATLEPWLATLRRNFLEPDELWLGPDASFAVALESPKRSRMRRSRRMVSALAGLAIVQSVILVVTYRSVLDSQIEQVSANLERSRAAMHEHVATTRKAETFARTLVGIRARAAGSDSTTHVLVLLGRVLPKGTSYRELHLGHGGEGGLTLVSHDKIDPVAIVAATGRLTVTEVAELGSPQEGEHLYNVAFKSIASKPASE